MNYSYEIEGTGADDHTWKVSGTVGNVGPGGFMEAFQKAFVQSFSQLTSGKAVYGQPGVGCRGPYKITRCLLQERT